MLFICFFNHHFPSPKKPSMFWLLNHSFNLALNPVRNLSCWLVLRDRRPIFLGVGELHFVELISNGVKLLTIVSSVQSSETAKLTVTYSYIILVTYSPNLNDFNLKLPGQFKSLRTIQLLFAV